MPPTASMQSSQDELLGSLRSVRRRVRTLSVLFGAGLVMGAIVTLLLGTILIDYLLDLQAVPRLLCIAAAAFGVIWAIWVWIGRPIAARLTLGDVAGRLEMAFPQFDDRLRSTVDFARGDIPGSPVMQQRVMAEAGRLAAEVDMRRALSRSPVLWSLAGGLAAVAALVVLGLAFSDYARIALARLLVVNAPAWPKMVEISLLQDVPPKAAAGQRIEMRMRLARGDSPGMKPIVFYRYDDGPVQQQIMTRGQDGDFGVSLDARGRTMNVWVKAGDDQTEPRVVQVVPRLALAGVQASVAAPAYARVAPLAVDMTQMPASAVAGSAVELTLLFNKPLAPDRPVVLEAVRSESDVPPMLWSRPSPDMAVARWTAEQSLRFRVRAVDHDYFENAAVEEYELIVRPDQDPSVLIETPRGNEDRTAAAVVRLEALAEDDFDITSMELVVYRVGGDGEWELPLSGWERLDSTGLRKRFRIAYDWELSQLPGAELKPGDVLEYFVRVRDNYNLNGMVHEPAVSGRLRINIISQEALTRQVTDAIRAIAERVKTTRNAQDRTREETAGLRQETQDKPELDRGERTALSRLTEQQSTLASLTRQLAGRMAEIQRRLDENRSTNEDLRAIASDVQRMLQRTAEEPMSQAAQRLNQAAQALSGGSQSQSSQQDAAQPGAQQPRDAGEQQPQDGGERQPREQSDEPRRPDAREPRDPSQDGQRQQAQQGQSQDGQRQQAQQGQSQDGQRQQAQQGQSQDGQRQQQAQQGQQSEAQRRTEALRQGEQRQQEASDQLERALETMGNLGTFEELLQRAREALREQQRAASELFDVARQTIGKRPDQLTPEQRRELERVASEQRRQAENTERLTRDLERAAEQTQRSDPASSQAMQQAARQAQKQQVSSQQAQAAENAERNQQAQAQANQRQAELGLQMVLDTLRAAERRRLEQLARELAKLEELLANLIRRQAGHNVDNLMAQGSDAAIKLISDELLAKAQRLRDRPVPVPDEEQLTRSQILTENNTRDVARTAEEVPRVGAQIAAVLSRAAGFMERAIGMLKDEDLPQAYDPWQVRALASLEEAMQRAEDAVRDAEEQMQEASRDTIRQAYEKIRREQDQINAQTARIDSAPRLPDGSMRREDAVNLARLAGEQSALAEETEKLEERLRDLGSVVYVWANRHIVGQMNDVKAQLAKPDTGTGTQELQKQLVEELDAMIRNLAVKRPRGSDFNRPPGQPEGDQQAGGGGQAPRERMPSEVELRLLKEFQLAVNRGTRAQHAQQKPDDRRLEALGSRQGDLRNLLDQLIQQASRGEIRLAPEPDPEDRLPEEADVGAIDNQELEDWLASGKSGDEQLEQDIKEVGQRMARSRQRLAIDHDPGKTTQLIQERIIVNLDNLIEMARAQQQQMQQQRRQQRGQMAQRPQQQQNQGPQQADQQQQQQEQASNPAQREADRGGRDAQANAGRDIREDSAEWGGLTPRERAAIIEGRGERTIGKYERITNDYYEEMARRASAER